MVPPTLPGPRLQAALCLPLSPVSERWAYVGREDTCWEKGSARASLIHSLSRSLTRSLIQQAAAWYLLYEKRLSLGSEGHTRGKQPPEPDLLGVLGGAPAGGSRLLRAGAPATLRSGCPMSLRGDITSCWGSPHVRSLLLAVESHRGFIHLFC